MSLESQTIEIDSPDFVEQLRRRPIREHLLSAYRAELISDEMLFALLPDDSPSRVERIVDAWRSVLLGRLASIKSF